MGLGRGLVFLPRGLGGVLISWGEVLIFLLGSLTPLGGQGVGLIFLVEVLAPLGGGGVPDFPQGGRGGVGSPA